MAAVLSRPQCFKGRRAVDSRSWRPCIFLLNATLKLLSSKSFHWSSLLIAPETPCDDIDPGAWRHLAITWTNVELSVRFCGIYLILNSNLPETNELTPD